ncbi:hypothetical protein N7537_011724 [Penicillium hordei]|uniref:Uncharacterized protein n=1 Tax=Penicillium hordei TaxID=40994 RepID=A0AAD6DMD4_9EURO|nr:uncharacterized protein N7537_011724 [Penicillium hordei]KAJ5589046.1 hypothetical protein N7537_011724 [Penicillium hordei]
MAFGSSQGLSCLNLMPGGPLLRAHKDDDQFPPWYTREIPEPEYTEDKVVNADIACVITYSLVLLF